MTNSAALQGVNERLTDVERGYRIETNMQNENPMRSTPPVRTMIDQKQQQNVNY